MLFPLGNMGYDFVETGNRLAARCALMLYYSLSYGCRWLLEQPHGSTACHHPRLDEIFSNLPIFQTRIWGGAYAADTSAATPKRHVLYSNDANLLSRLSTAAGHLTGEELSALSGEKLVRKRKRDDGTETWTGNKDTMTKSQYGPQLFQKKRR